MQLLNCENVIIILLVKFNIIYRLVADQRGQKFKSLSIRILKIDCKINFNNIMMNFALPKLYI